MGLNNSLPFFILFLNLSFSFPFQRAAADGFKFKSFKCKTLAVGKGYTFKIVRYKSSELFLLKGEVKKIKGKKEIPISRNRKDIGLHALWVAEKCELHLIDGNPGNVLFHLRMDLAGFPRVNPTTEYKRRASWDFKIDRQTVTDRFLNILECVVMEFKIPDSIFQKCRVKEAVAPTRFEHIKADPRIDPVDNGGDENLGEDEGGKSTSR